MCHGIFGAFDAPKPSDSKEHDGFARATEIAFIWVYEKCTEHAAERELLIGDELLVAEEEHAMLGDCLVELRTSSSDSGAAKVSVGDLSTDRGCHRCDAHRIVPFAGRRSTLESESVEPGGMGDPEHSEAVGLTKQGHVPRDPLPRPAAAAPGGRIVPSWEPIENRILGLIHDEPGLTDAQIMDRTGISPRQQVDYLPSARRRRNELRVPGSQGAIVNVLAGATPTLLVSGSDGLRVDAADDDSVRAPSDSVPGAAPIGSSAATPKSAT